MTAETTQHDRITEDFFRMAGTPLAVLSADGRLMETNDAWGGLFADASSPRGARLVDLLRAADSPAATRALDSAKVGRSTEFDACLNEVLGPSARSIRFSVTGMPDGRAMLVAVPRPPGRADEALLTIFDRVLESAPVILWAIDAEGNYTLSEGRGLQLLGFEPGETVGLNALDMFKDHPETAAALVRALGGEESRLLTTPAPGVHFENWYMPLRQDGGSEVSGVMGLALDASDRVRSERELREKIELIERQSATIRALATPIIQVWDEVLCLPVIGTVDSARTAEMMQGLLEAIVREQARFAIVDLTGVEVVDTSTADHLIQLFRAAKVLGVDGILCGIRPAVAQTVVALGLELGSVRTMRSLRDALRWCIAARSSDATARANRVAARHARDGSREVIR